MKWIDEALVTVEDCMDRAVDAYPDSAKIDILWAGMKELRERLRGWQEKKSASSISHLTN